ncbi:MAG: T9SS type A sorting domain-containing protein, partial [Flavobacteriales bacterium]|nr:T9SS type A sorting domain-containing protein [Flavobacteriales bacterium]
EVYNVMGQKLATLVNGVVTSGNHTVTFDATNFASGMYLYKLTVGNFTSVKSMMLIK